MLDISIVLSQLRSECCTSHRTSTAQSCMLRVSIMLSQLRIPCCASQRAATAQKCMLHVFIALSHRKIACWTSPSYCHSSEVYVARLIALPQLKQGKVREGEREPLALKPNVVVCGSRKIVKRTATKRANGNQNTIMKLQNSNDMRHHNHMYNEGVILNASLTTSQLM